MIKRSPTGHDQPAKSSQPLYPPALKLFHVSFFHRHGERTPISDFLPSHVPASTWNVCHLVSSFNASLESYQQELSTHTPDPNPQQHKPYHPAAESGSSQLGTSFHSNVETSNGPSLPPFISQGNVRDVGPVLRTMEELNPHSVSSASSKPAFVKGQCFFGQLTDKGRETLYQLGTHLRHLYVDQLGLLDRELTDQSVSENFHFRTTDYPRTLESLQHLLGGLYPVSTRSKLSQPPRVHTRMPHEETLVASGQCKRYRQLVKQFKEKYRAENSQQISQLKEKHAEFLKQDSKPTLHALYDLFVAQWAHGMPLPHGVGDTDLAALEHHAQMSWFEVYRHDSECTKLAMGRFLQEYKRMMEEVLTATTRLKFAVFSCHDSSIAPLLGALRVGDGMWPTFASNISIEYFKDETVSSSSSLSGKNKNKKAPKEGEKNADVYVRLKYNMDVVTIPECQKKGNGHEKLEGYCTLKAFMQVVESNIPADYEKECNAVVS